MKTRIVIEVTHSKPIELLSNKVVNRAYSIQGVENAELITDADELREAGFTPGEIALGTFEVYRG